MGVKVELRFMTRTDGVRIPLVETRRKLNNEDRRFVLEWVKAVEAGAIFTPRRDAGTA